MRPTALVALAALLALPALAQAPEPGPASSSDSKLPLAAMRHQQPRRDEVDKLEQQRFGAKAQQIQQQQQGAEVDKLYQDVMRRSAPGASGQE